MPQTWTNRQIALSAIAQHLHRRVEEISDDLNLGAQGVSVARVLVCKFKRHFLAGTNMTVGDLLAQVPK